MKKLFPSLLSLGLVVAVLSPIRENWRAQPHDSFPLSYFPMFSARRKATETFYYLVGRDKQGARYLIPFLYAGSAGLNQTRRQIDRIVREQRASQLAETVAERLTHEAEAPWSRIV